MAHLGRAHALAEPRVARVHLRDRLGGGAAAGLGSARRGVGRGGLHAVVHPRDPVELAGAPQRLGLELVRARVPARPHPVATPGGPVPTPLPNPFVGMVFDPAGLAVGLALGAAIAKVTGAPVTGPVLINCMPATNAGTECTATLGVPHILIPPGTGWAPMPKTPKPVIRPGETPKPPKPVVPDNDAVVITGSQTVTAMGASLCRLGDLAMSCSEPVRLPSSTLITIPKGPPVLVGGPMSVSITDVLMAAVRTRFISDSAHALLSRMRPGRLRNLLGRGVCFLTGHPVDVATGRMLTNFVDFELDGPVPLRFERMRPRATVEDTAMSSKLGDDELPSTATSFEFPDNLDHIGDDEPPTSGGTLFSGRGLSKRAAGGDLLIGTSEPGTGAVLLTWGPSVARNPMPKYRGGFSPNFRNAHSCRSWYYAVMSERDERELLPKPKLVFDTEAAEHGPSLTLEELLEQATRTLAVDFGDRPLVGECVDTHNPHLPARILVQARGEGGKLAAAWLPILADLRVRPGQRVLLSKPHNWPEPVVVGVLAGLEPPGEDAGKAAQPTVPSEPSLRLEPGQGLVVQGPSGQPLVRVSATCDGEARIELLPKDVDLEVPGRLRLGGESVELRARSGDIDLRTEGDTIVRARVIRLN